MIIEHIKIIEQVHNKHYFTEIVDVKGALFHFFLLLNDKC